MEESWVALADQQQGVISRAQLDRAGVTRSYERAQLRARRWQQRTPMVFTTTTGPLSRDQALWVGLLHVAGLPESNTALVGGLTAAGIAGLRHWPRDEMTLLVRDETTFEPLQGYRFFRTRRSLPLLRMPGPGLPVCRLEPALLLHGAHEQHRRTALGAVAAAVQQQLTTPEQLRPWIGRLRPLRRAAQFRTLLSDLAGGADSLAEADVVKACRSYGLAAPARQRRRRDRQGRLRFIDFEWDLPDGTVVALEVDGAFHMEFAHYAEDVRRARSLAAKGRIQLRCTSDEIRHDPDAVLADLAALGVPRHFPELSTQRVAIATARVLNSGQRRRSARTGNAAR